MTQRRTSRALAMIVTALAVAIMVSGCQGEPVIETPKGGSNAPKDAGSK